MTVPIVSLLVGLAACQQGPLATFEGGAISRADYLSYAEANRRLLRATSPRQVLESLVLETHLSRRALEEGVDRDPGVAVGLRRIELQAWTRLLRASLEERIEVPEAEVSAYLEDHRDELSKPRKVRLFNIFKQVPADSDRAAREAIRQEAEEILARLQAGESFQQLAATESDSQTRFYGGRMGAIEAGSMPAEIEAAAFALADGEFSGVLETPEGFTILLSQGQIEPRVLSEDEARKRILEAKKRWASEEEWQRLSGELREAARISIDWATPLAASGGPDDVVARGRGGSLLRRQLAALLAPIDVADASRQRLAKVIDNWYVGLEAEARCRELGLSWDAQIEQRVARAQRQRLAEAVLHAEIERRLEPPAEDAMRRRYEQNRGRFMHLPEFRLSLIELPFDQASLRERSEQASALTARLRARPRDFPDVARSLSAHRSAPSGGDIGWISRRQLAALGPALFRAVQELSTGSISDPVRQDDGLWIVRLEAAEPARPMTFEEARPAMVRRYEASERNRLRQSIRKEWLDELRISVAAPFPEVSPSPSDAETDADG